MKTIEELVGENVARFRKLRGWTQAELADRISALQGGERQFHRSAVSHVEQGLRALNIADLTLIALAFEVPPGSLILLGERDADDQPIDDVRVGDQVFDRDRIQAVGDALDPDSPAQYVLEIARDLTMRVSEAQALVDRLDDLHTLAMTARVRALRVLQASTPERSGD